MSKFSWKQKWVAIAPKPFGIFSIIGSVYIIRHVLSSPKRRGATYHRILLGLSTYDIMTSIAVFMGTWPIPRNTPGVFMASGTERTCSAQGFFIQNGVGTPLYNASLATYYFLVIFLGWKERQIRKVEPLLHLIPITFSLGTAITVAATDSYSNSNVWCWITSKNNAFRFGFFYGPVWFAVGLVTIIMTLIWAKVFLQERKVQKYTQHEVQSNEINHGGSRTRNRASSSSKIASQGLFYVITFYLTFVFPSWTRISQMISGGTPFSAIALFSIFFPMQGFFNCLVYFRPRFLRYRRENPKLNVVQIICLGAGSAITSPRRSMFHKTGRASSLASNPDRLNNSHANSRGDERISNRISLDSSSASPWGEKQESQINIKIDE